MKLIKDFNEYRSINIRKIKYFLKNQYDLTKESDIFLEFGYETFQNYYETNSNYNGYQLVLGVTGVGLKIIDNVRYLFQLNYNWNKYKGNDNYKGFSYIRGQLRYNF